MRPICTTCSGSSGLSGFKVDIVDASHCNLTLSLLAGTFDVSQYPLQTVWTIIRTDRKCPEQSLSL